MCMMMLPFFLFYVYDHILDNQAIVNFFYYKNDVIILDHKISCWLLQLRGMVSVPPCWGSYLPI